MKYTILSFLILVLIVGFIYLLITNPNLAIILLLLLGLAFFLKNSIKIINEYERAIIFRFGRFHRVAGPGLVFVLPGIDKIYQIIDVRTKALQFYVKDAYTSDGAKVDIVGVIYYRVINPRRAVLNVENFTEQIQRLIASDVRDLIAGMTLRELFTNVEVLNKMIYQRISPILRNWGIDLRTLQVRRVIPAPEIAEMLVKRRAMEEEYYIRKMLADARRITLKALGEGARFLDDKAILYLYMMALQELAKHTGNVDLISLGGLQQAFGDVEEIKKSLANLGISLPVAISMIKKKMLEEKKS